LQILWANLPCLCQSERCYMQNIRAEAQLSTRDLRGDLGFFGKMLGFRLDRIFPADDPRVGR
jgi:hypothetical protein